MSLPEGRDVTLWEMTQYLIRVSLPHLRRILREEASLPQGAGASENATRQFSLKDLRAIQTHLGLPSLKQSPALAVIGADAGHSAGLAALVAVRAALKGYDVVAADVGGQGALTARLSDEPVRTPAAGEVLLAQSAAAAHRRTNRARAEMGEPPLALPAGLGDLPDEPPTALATRWPGLSLYPGGGLTGLALDWGLWQRVIPRWTGRTALEGLEPPPGGLLVMDAGSEPGPLMLAALERADILLVADGGGAPDWLPALERRLTRQDQALAQSAAALGEPHQPLSWRALRRVPVGQPLASPNDLPPLAPEALPPDGTVWDILPRSRPRADYVMLRAGPEAFWDAVEVLLEADIGH